MAGAAGGCTAIHCLRMYIIPSAFNLKVVEAIRDKVIKAAIASGVARRIPMEYR